MTHPSFDLERSFEEPCIGMDEAGRGPWAGPVHVASVCFHTYNNLPNWVYELNDSKKLSKKKRLKLYHEIRTAPLLSYHIQSIGVDTIDRLNILQATLHGMRECYKSLNIEAQAILVDGNQNPFEPTLGHPIIKGDSKSLSIAAASVLAKVSRDLYMENLSCTYPEYGWETNAGYGTKSHQEALQAHGPTEHHRKSFAPIKAFIV